jgi:hypothetical protein
MCASIAYEFMFVNLQYTLTHLFQDNKRSLLYLVRWLPLLFLYPVQVSRILLIFPSSIVNSALNCV